MEKLISSRSVGNPAKPGEAEASDVAKLFEEIKVMFRDLPERLNGQLADALGPRIQRRRRLHPRMAMELTRNPEPFGDPALWWLVIISSFRDELPWVYELGMEVHKALKVGSPHRVSVALERFERSVMIVTHTDMGRYLVDSPEVDILMHELPHMLNRFIRRERPIPKLAVKPKGEALKNE